MSCRPPSNLADPGRYHLQAEQQLSNDWTLHRCGQNKSVLSWQEYLVTIPPSSPTEHVRIGLDPALITVQDFKTILPTLPPHMTLVPLASNLVDAIWDDQPSQPANAIFLHPLKWAGESTAAKLKAVRAKLVEEKTVGLVVNLLDEIACAYVECRAELTLLEQGFSTCAARISRSTPSSLRRSMCRRPTRARRRCTSRWSRSTIPSTTI